MRGLQTIPDQSAILAAVAIHSEQPEFRYFLNSCIKKWDEVRPEMEETECIMDSICQSWRITRVQLMSSRKFVEARSFFFYVLHKKLDLSYDVIAEMFSRPKSNVHGGVKNIEFMIENRGQKALVSAFEQVEMNLEARKA